MLFAPGSTPDANGLTEAGVPAGLFHSSDAGPGITRVKRGKGFAYRAHDGQWVRDAAVLARIRRLAIPPAYTAVWICDSPRGHLQATGRDARGRKQYRYHEAWRQERDSGKFGRLPEFAQALPRLRSRVRRDLAQRQHTRERVLATLVHLLDTTLIRVGNGQYARDNQSFGLTTLQSRHACIEDGCLKLSFKGKSGVSHQVTVDDARVLRVVRRCLDLPGRELFQYRGEDGALHTVNSADVNDYLHAACGAHFTAKDFRTWHGSVRALQALRSHAGAREGRFLLGPWLAEVAQDLGNTPAVCRKAYIHPEVLALALRQVGKPNRPGRDARPTPEGLDPQLPEPRRRAGLTAHERRLLAFLGTAPAAPAS